MIIYPAIDLKDGKCVRLYQGEMDKVTTYNENPAAQAQEFAEAGFSWLHVVDLNGAVDGKPVNSEAVRNIMEAVDLPIQLGGGIRSLDQIKTWFEEGVNRVILGTAAVKNPDLVAEACDLFPHQIVLSVDAHGFDVATEGWVEGTEVTAVNLVREFEDLPLAAVIYTDITRDGTGVGLNMGNTQILADMTSIPIIASGGVGSMRDLESVYAADGVEGVIIGKAIYDGRIDPQEALKLAADGP